MIARGMYQEGPFVAPWVMADIEGERVQVYRQGFGWVDRPAEVEVATEPVEVEQGAESAA